MTWREKTVIAILLLVAKMIARDAATKKEIQDVANHISVNAPKPDPDHPERFVG